LPLRAVSTRRATFQSNDWNAGQALSGRQLLPQTAKLDAQALGGQFALPVVVIQGAEDFTTPTSLARMFVASIRAPHKEFVTIRDADTSRRS